jgi:hypothetical protein
VGEFATLKAEDVDGNIWNYKASAMRIRNKAEHTFK